MREEKEKNVGWFVKIWPNGFEGIRQDVHLHGGRPTSYRTVTVIAERPIRKLRNRNISCVQYGSVWSEIE